MELSLSTGLGRKSKPKQEMDIEAVSEPDAQDNLIAAAPREKHESKTSPWGCFYCSADVKLSEDAIKALKTGKNKKDDESKTAFHTYQQRKTFGQGMMDLALLTANVNQLRAILDAKMKHPYYHVIVGISLILNSRVNVSEETDVSNASRVSNITFACTFVITIANIFLSVFYEADNK